MGTNVRVVTVALEDLSPKARIREVALALFAEHGPRATSIRMIADAAGMSAGAVTHHYGSKAEIEKAVREVAVERMRPIIHGVGMGRPTIEALMERRTAASRYLREHPVLAGYMRHVYADGGPEANALFAEFGRLQREEMDAMVEAGLARPLPDPEIGNLLCRTLMLASVLLRPMFEAALGQPLDTPGMSRRFREAEIDLLTRPLYPVQDAATT